MGVNRKPLSVIFGLSLPLLCFLNNVHAADTASAALPSSSQPASVIPIPRTTDGKPDKHSKALFEGNVKRVKKGNFDIVFYGDSITEAMNTAQMKKYFGPRVDHFGVGGDRTQHLLWRLQHGELDFKSAPKVAVLLIGTNNIPSWPGWPGSSNPEIFQGVIADITEIQNKLPKTKILVLGILPRDKDGNTSNRSRIIEINDLIKNVADNNRIWYLDLGPVLLEADKSISPKVMPDYLHPSPAGYDRMFKAIKPVTDSLLK